MTGLRDKMKRRRRESVLVAAESLFRERGYERTSIEEIAGRAEVSIGTLYKYFGSKGGIMHELVQPVIEEMKRKGQAVIDKPPPKAADAFAALYRAYQFSDDWKSLNLLRAFDNRVPEADQHLVSVAKEFVTFIRKQLAALVRKLASQGRFNPRLNANDVSYVLQVLLFAHFQEYLTAGGRMSYEDDLVDLHRRLRLLFLRWDQS